MTPLRTLARLCRRSWRERIGLGEAIRREAAELAATIEHLVTRRQHVPALLLVVEHGRFRHVVLLYPSDLVEDETQRRKLDTYLTFFDDVEEAMTR